MKKRSCLFLSVLFLLFSISASASSYDQSSPTATVQSFILAMLRGDSKAFAQLTKDVMPWYYFESDLLEFANEEMAQSALSDYYYYESDNNTIVLYNSQNTPFPQNEDFFCMQLVRGDGKYYINELRLPRHSRGVYSNTWNERCDTAMQSEGKCLAYVQMAADAKDKSSIQENTEGFELSGTILTKYTGTASSVSIPDGVTGIWDYAFSQNTVLKSVIIPNSVTAIGEFAFYDCSALESVQFPSSMTSIAQSAFYKCTSLQTITLPYGIENISSSLFYGCSALQDVTIPTSVTRINSGAFSNCRSLEKIAIPDNVTYIESGAFDAGFGVTLKVVAGSKAERFARDYWFDYEYYTPEVQVNRPIPSKEQQKQSVFEYDQSSRVSTAKSFMWAMLNGDTKALTTLTKDIIPWYYFESDLLEHGTNVMSGSEMTDFCYFESDENTLLLYDKRVTPSPDIMDFYCMDFVKANGKYYISELRLPHHSRGAYGYKWDERCKAVLNGVGNTFNGVEIKQTNENSSSYTENNDGYQYVETEKPQLSAPKMIAPEKQYGGVFSISGSIQVKWTAVEGATQYKIYIKDVTDIPEIQWNDPETDAPSVFKDGVYVYKSPSIENNVVSLDIKQQADFTMGHTYKGCIMASDDGIHYSDSEGPVFFFSVGTEKEIISLFDIQLTQANNNLTAYMNSTVTAKWTIPEQKQVTDYVLDGYLVELFVTDYAMKDLYAQTIVDNSVDSFAVKLSDWQRVDGNLGIAETKKGKNPYLFSVTPIIVKPDGNKVLGKASAFNLTVYATKNVDEPKGLDVKGKWIPWSGWVIDPNADKDITASWNTYKGNGHKLRLIWNKKGGNRLGDYSVSKKVAGYNLEKDKLEGEGTYLARLYAVYSESLYDGCVYTYVESKPATKEFKVGAWSGTPDESEESGKETKRYETVTAPVSGTEVEGKIKSTWKWSENGSWASYQGGKPKEDRIWHVGIDIGVANSDIHPIADGIVVQSGTNSANGNTITIEHTMLIDGKETTVYSFYAHMRDKSKFEASDPVTTSDVIGTVGNTGSSSLGAHLHLAIITGSAPQANTVGYVYLKDFYSEFAGKKGSTFESLLQTYVADEKIQKGPSSSDYDVLGVDSVTYGNQTFHNPWNFIMEGSTYQYLVNPPREDSDNTSDSDIFDQQYDVVPVDVDTISAIASVSARHEAGANPARVSSGAGDKGGVSYGLYQFAGLHDRPREFALWMTKQNNAKWNEIGKDLLKNYVSKEVSYKQDSAFSNCWVTWGTGKDRVSFGEAQTVYQYKQHYVGRVQSLANTKIPGTSKTIPGLGVYGTEENTMPLSVHQMLWARIAQGAPGNNSYIAECYGVAQSKVDAGIDLFGGDVTMQWIWEVYWEASKINTDGPTSIAPTTNRSSAGKNLITSSNLGKNTRYSDKLVGHYLVYFGESSGNVQVGVYARLNPKDGTEYTAIKDAYLNGE